MSNVIQIPAKGLTVEQALNEALKNAEGMKSVLIIGVDDAEKLYIGSSRMANCEALWLAKLAELSLLGFE